MTEQRVALPDDARVDRLVFGDFGQLGECLIDEDDGDEAGETLLGEAGDVANEEAELESDDHLQRDHHPEADPEAKRDERKIVVPARENAEFR